MLAKLPIVLQYASAASAFISAGLWLWSAMVRLPRRTVRRWENDRPAPSTPRDDAMARQSKINAGAALAAGVAALLQGIATVLTG